MGAFFFFSIYPYEIVLTIFFYGGVQMLVLEWEVRDSCRLCFEYHNVQPGTGFLHSLLLFLLSPSDSIFVRVYESRIDLLRAVIIGAEGTPYHDGLFFFDVFFPSGYPNVPPVCGLGYCMTCIVFMFTLFNFKSDSGYIFLGSTSTTTLVVFVSTQIYIIVAKYALAYSTPGLAIRMRSGFQVFRQFYRF